MASSHTQSTLRWLSEGRSKLGVGHQKLRVGLWNAALAARKQSSQLRSHYQTKNIATWGRNIRPDHIICKPLLTNTCPEYKGVRYEGWNRKASRQEKETICARDAATRRNSHANGASCVTSRGSKVSV
jgi:hypothetical protein